MNIKELLLKVAKESNSDVHLLYGYRPVVRKDGDLRLLLDNDGKSFPILTDKDFKLIIDELLNPEQKERLMKNKDLDLAISIDSYRFRTNISHDQGHLKLSARVIKELNPSVEEIGLSKEVIDLLNLSQGLILVTGPTGCGKSTTLAAMINYINQTRSTHIVTLEDPIEFIFKEGKGIISQRQLGQDIPSFASGLKHILRQDPDVVMVGEMRDLETIATTITLAETGHLVLATLHTYSAAQTIDRIVDVFPPHQQQQIRSQLSNTLVAVISQRLVPRKDGKGRVAAREIMFQNSASANMIRENKIAQLKTVLETNIKAGMSTMDRDIKRLYQEDIISEDTALRYLNEGGL